MKTIPICRRPVSLCLTGLLCGMIARAASGAEPDVRRDATVAAIEQVMPSVVNIATKTVVPVSDPNQQRFREFLHQRPFDEYYSLGSGVVIDEAGYLLTNDHVVRRADVIAVRFGTGTNDYEATLVASDPDTDVALLKLKARPGEIFKAIKLAPEDDLLLGETVLALGNPLGLGGSVSRGILSSKSRTSPQEGEPLTWKNWLQTDAPINQGNSGGPLVNLRGELIGINVRNVAAAQSIGFAIPVKQLLVALADFFRTEFVKSYWFGARVKSGTNPLVLADVQPDSPADRAGLKPGDAILQVNGRRPKSFIDFASLLAPNATSEIALTIERGADTKNIAVQLVPEKAVFNAELIRNKLGLSLTALSRQEVIARYKISVPTGAFVISSVQEAGPAAAAGLKPDILVTAIDGQWAEELGLNPTTVAKLLYWKKPGDPVRLGIAYWQRAGLFRQQVVELKAR